MKLYYADIRGLDKKRARHAGRSGSHGSAFAASLLAFAVKDYWGLDEVPPIAAALFGKPYFPTQPEKHFSISHTKTHVLVALSDKAVGADIQTHRDRLPRVYSRLTSECERRDFNFYDLWALRESFFKLTGKGSLRTLRFRIEDGVILAPDARVHCRLYDAIPGCSVAVSSYGSQFPDLIIFVPQAEICT